ncbi:ABC transporter substrate-binding protein [Galbitalea soli]|uniref:Spermidine/putrescine ABC transporter substrate-binding protein n=1 Tax=Galbitalea soli TaxID=1268042 RepID=A0A7C9PLR3_9MICO|nr:spermidine/putrescine ABC transporter substrate-binding protein [Galbitalea soli]NEM90433.1 spermidine/putrescine ABC transporter substrate-binding protein [Galbitalea soli]NYJ31144.1 spermidine/putrescine transport system substrate-binding protein [Galbitalea soli]
MRSLPEDPMIRQLVQQIRASQVTRRTMLGGAAASAAALALAACAPIGGAKKLQPAKDISATDKTMTWANWALYLDQNDQKQYPTLLAFEKETGIQVKYDIAVDDNNSYYAKVKDQLALGQDIGADTVCLTDWMVSRWINLGYTQKLDHAKIPNLSNLAPRLQNPDFDPGRNYSVPWQSGFAGLCWNKEKLPKGIKQVSDLWDPALKGRIGVLSEMRDTIGLIMLEQGVDISSKSWGDKEFNAAIAEFKKQVDSGQIRNIKGNSYADDLKNEDTLAAIVWSGDVEGINADIGSDKFGFVIPETGGTLWSDNYLIPIGSKKKTNAETLINYYYEPEVAATVAAYVNYITPVEGAQEAMKKIDPSLVDDQLIFPNADTFSQVKLFRTLTNAENTRYNSAFEAVGLGA